MNPPTGLRSSTFPTEHLDAELLAAPFASDSAFAEALAALDPKLPKTMVPLWREAERDLLFRFPGLSVDELIFRRDHTWFGAPGQDGPVPLGEVLRRATSELLTADAGQGRLRSHFPGTQAERRRVWRWLTFALPADLLLAAADAEVERLELVSPRLRTQLADRGVSEPHLHLKAAIGFPALWASAMRSLARLDARENMFESPGAERDEGRGLAPLLLRCALVRLLLAVFLNTPSMQQHGFSAFLEQYAAPGLYRRFGAIACRPLWRTVFSLAAGQAEQADAFPVLRDLYARLIAPDRSDCTVAEFDPLSHWFAPAPDRHPDFAFTRAALAYLQHTDRDDTLFARAFWQTVRGRVQFFRHVVQRPMVPGLQWFSRTYARLSAPRKPVRDADFVHQAAALAGPGLQALEVRITPSASLSEMLGTLRQLDKAGQSLPVRPDGQPPELGITFHISRSRGPAADQGRPPAWSLGGHDDPAWSKSNPSGYRYSGYYREQRAGAMALASLLMAYPRLLERVRGIDLCTDELGVPLWVVKPLVEHVQQAADQAAKHLRRMEGGNPRPLGVTVHAGEDFVHLMGGIRRVDETVEQLQLGEGARIGHAVALGVNVEAWGAQKRHLAIPRGERLFDLLWAWRVAKRAPEALHAWLPWINQELLLLGHALFGKHMAVADMDHWWAYLHDSRVLRRVGFPDGPCPAGLASNELSPQGWVYRWLTDRALFQSAQELVPIDIGREIDLVKTLQARVRRVLGNRGIVVEINPSSNLLIGHLGDLTSHPLWRLCPPPGIVGDAPAVRVCIGSDDPITFTTGLPEEYQLLADALTEAGLAGPDVDAWLEEARLCGLAARFTVPRSKADLFSPMRADTLSPLL